MNSEALLRDRIRTLINKRQIDLAIAEVTVALHSSYLKDLRFLTSDDTETLVPTIHGILDTQSRKGKRGPRQMSAEARQRIAVAKRERWARNKARALKVIRWTPEDEEKIIHVVKQHEKITIPELTREVSSKLPSRPITAIGQRIYRLIQQKRIKRLTPGKNPGIPITVGAA